MTEIQESCEATCTRWRHRPDKTEPDVRYCTFCLGAIISANVADWKKLDGCTVTTADPAFPQRDHDIPYWRDANSPDEAQEVAA